MWITAMLIGYTSGATIVYLIPVGLTMLNRKDHKYLALGAMAGVDLNTIWRTSFTAINYVQ